MSLQVLTNSRLRAVRKCQRFHHLAYELGYRPVVEDENLHFGTLFHLGLAAWFTAPPGARLTAALEAIQREANEFDRVRAEVLLCGYDARWSAEPMEVIAVEAAFESPLVNPDTGAASRTFLLAGKIDALIRDGDGRLLVVEHKTAADDIGVGSDYWKRLRLDGQVSTYFDGAAALGYQVDGCLYDVIRKPALRPSAVPLTDEQGVKIVHDAAGNRVRTKDGKKWRETGDTASGYVLQTRPETPAEFGERLVKAIEADPNAYYQRGEVTRLEAEMDEARFDRWQQAQQIREAQRAKRAPRNPEACVRMGTCPYFAACCGEASLEDPTQFRKLEDVNPELAA